MKFLLTTILILLLPVWAGAATYPIPWDGDGETIVDGDTFCSGVCQAGDILEFASGTDTLWLEDVVGTSANPIILRNTNAGQAVIDVAADQVCIRLVDCEYVTVDGTNAGGVTYGIRLTGSYIGIWSGGYLLGATGIEVHHVQIDDMVSQGMMIRAGNDDTFDPIVGPKIHDTYLFDIGREGYYLGGTDDGNYHQNFEVHFYYLTPKHMRTCAFQKR